MTSDVVRPSDANSGEDYYLVNYPDYARQNSTRKLEFYLSLLRRRVPVGSMVFELGVGMGAFLKRASREYRCGGCDVNAFGVSVTRTVVPSADVRVGSYEEIPVDPSLRAVVSWDVLEHLPDLGAGLHTIFERLPTNGLLIAVVPRYDGPLGWFVRRLDRDPTHVNKWGRDRWLDALKATGFEVPEWGGIIRSLVGHWYVHMSAPQVVLRQAGSAIYFVARKPTS